MIITKCLRYLVKYSIEKKLDSLQAIFFLFFLQFIEGPFEDYLKRLENPQVCSNLFLIEYINYCIQL